jgi:hypothetical protein
MWHRCGRAGFGEGKHHLEGSRRRIKDNIKMALKEIGWEFMDRIVLTQERDSSWTPINAAINLLIHKIRGIA